MVPIAINNYYIANNVPQDGFKPTEVGVTGFQLNAKRTLYLQATPAGLKIGLFQHKLFYIIEIRMN